MSKPRKWRRRLMWWSGGFVVCLLLFFGLMNALMWHWVARPPALTGERAITQLEPAARGDRIYLGKNWFGKRDGLPVLFVTGTPFEMGYANAKLTQEFVHKQEDTMVQLLNHVAPYRWTQFLLKFLVVYKNRHLQEHIVPEYQFEIVGLSQGCPDEHPEMGPVFNRILNYHAAQDISYMMMNSPLVRGGCTAFGAWGSHTQEGHLLLGRNFDWEPHPIFDKDRILIIYEPKQGIPFISLAWAGMVGCVSGMNREGVCITVNGAPSDLPSNAATPTCMVAREVLQYAHNLAEAQEIIRKRQVFVSALFLLGSKTDGRFVVVEKTPDQMVVRESNGSDSIICANHYETADLKDLPVNDEFKRINTSVSRDARMKELLTESYGKLNPTHSSSILRDRRLPGGHFAGNGHRASLNPLIATHAVIMDLTEGLFWAGTTPHQLGRFVAFDVNNWEKKLPDKTLPEDPILINGDYKRYQAAQAKLEESLGFLKREDFVGAAKCAAQAEKDNPGLYRNDWLLAESLYLQGKTNEAVQACQAAWDGRPALYGERKKIEHLARRLGMSLADRSPPESAKGNSHAKPGTGNRE